MKQFTTYSLTILTAILIQSCIPPSTDQTEKIDTPDHTKTKDFGIEITGQTIYQFYQKYGFTDLEEQLILIVKPDNVDFLTADLPFDSLDIKRLEKIDLRKFIKDKPVIFAPEKTMQADIRLESKEYDSGQDKSVFHNEGKYGLTKTDTTETIFMFDSQTGLMYVESKKQNNSR
jgi:hypothetical protein